MDEELERFKRLKLHEYAASLGYELDARETSRRETVMRKAGDKISIQDKFKENPVLKRSVESLQKRGVPEWLEVDTTTLSGSFKKVPTKDEIALPVQEQLIVELYSK